MLYITLYAASTLRRVGAVVFKLVLIATMAMLAHRSGTLKIIFDHPYFVCTTLLVVLGSYLYWTTSEHKLYRRFPIIALHDEGLDAKASWIQKGCQTVQRGLETIDGPFQVITGTGPKICLPNRFADELKNRPELSLGGAFKKDFFGSYPGFQPFKKISSEHANMSVVPQLVRTKLTQSLDLIAEDMVDEIMVSLPEIFGQDKEWREIPLKRSVSLLVTRLTSRIFLGLPLCRDDRWLRIAQGYTADAFASARALRQVPGLIRPFVHWFLAPCIELRRDYREAHDLITPEVQWRKTRARELLESGGKLPRTEDAIGWMYELTQGQGKQTDYVDAQLELAVSAIHTSTEAICSALIDILAHREILQPLRDEINDVIGGRGFSPQTLHELRLMDSFLRENQRFHPTNASTYKLDLLLSSIRQLHTLL
jgi:hypothetical protein